MSLSIYLVDPAWNGDPENAHEAVVKTLKHGPGYINDAIELWRLAGDAERAEKIEQIARRGYARDSLVLDTDDIAAMNALLLNGLDDALKRSIIDSDWRIPVERMAEARLRSRLPELSEQRGESARDAVTDVFGRVATLSAFLTEALDLKLHVALG
jgi:hypothetical protein